VRFRAVVHVMNAAHVMNDVGCIVQEQGAVPRLKAKNAKRLHEEDRDVCHIIIRCTVYRALVAYFASLQPCRLLQRSLQLSPLRCRWALWRPALRTSP
jgi:hypothetical protein